MRDARRRPRTEVSTTLRQGLPSGVARTSCARKRRCEDVASTEFETEPSPALPPSQASYAASSAGTTTPGPGPVMAPCGHRRQRRREGSASGPVRNLRRCRRESAIECRLGGPNAGLHEGHSRGPPECPLPIYYYQYPKSDISQPMNRVLSHPTDPKQTQGLPCLNQWSPQTTLEYPKPN